MIAAHYLLLVLPNAGGVPADITGPPYCIETQGIFQSGSQSVSVFSPGILISDVWCPGVSAIDIFATGMEDNTEIYITGACAIQVHCET